MILQRAGDGNCIAVTSPQHATLLGTFFLGDGRGFGMGIIPKVAIQRAGPEGHCVKGEVFTRIIQAGRLIPSVFIL